MWWTPDKFLRSDRERQLSAERMDGGCVEIALDLDFFTWSTFSNVDNATEWALAMMAGASNLHPRTERVGLAASVVRPHLADKLAATR